MKYIILQCQPPVQHLEKFPKGIWKSVDITPRKEVSYYTDALRVRGILSLYMDIRSLLPLLSNRHKNPHPPLPNVLCLLRLMINFTSCSMTGKAIGSGHSQNVGPGTASCKTPYVGKAPTLGLILHVLHHQCFVSTHSLPLWCTILTTDQSTIDLAQSTSMTPLCMGLPCGQVQVQQSKTQTP
jgi:hypothetical protein